MSVQERILSSREIDKKCGIMVLSIYGIRCILAVFFCIKPDTSVLTARKGKKRQNDARAVWLERDRL